MQNHKLELVSDLKTIITTAQNNLDAFQADQLEYKHLENGMNYIRLCTQSAQMHAKNCLDSSCEEYVPKIE